MVNKDILLIIVKNLLLVLESSLIHKSRRLNSNILLICRKDSLGYIDFLRGKYPLYDQKYIQALVDEMTLH